MSNFFKKLFGKGDDDIAVSAAAPDTGSAGHGKLPPAGEPVVFHGVALPEGKHLLGKRTPSKPWREPRAWCAFVPQEEIGPLWTALAERFPETGLWPIQLGGLDARIDVFDQDWQPWELPKPEFPNEDYDAATFFIEEHPPQVFLDDKEIDLPPWFTGPFFFAQTPEADPVWVNPLHLPPPWYGDPLLTRPERPDLPEGIWLLLVPVDRPADVFGYLNWKPFHTSFGGKELTAVLRSWEDRFGAAVTTLGVTSFELSVKRLPESLAEAQQLAREHILVSSDTSNVESYAELPEELLNQRCWHFWWD